MNASLRYRIIYLASKWWHNRRRQALEKAEFKCQKCGSRKKLRVHHKNYDRLGREKAKDLEVLCELCHNWEHSMVLEMNAHLDAIVKEEW